MKKIFCKNAQMSHKPKNFSLIFVLLFDFFCDLKILNERIFHVLKTPVCDLEQLTTVGTTLDLLYQVPGRKQASISRHRVIFSSILT